MAEKRKNPAFLLEAAEAIFHLEGALQKAGTLPPGHSRAVEIVWEKVDRCLAEEGLEAVRRAGVPFDPRRHEAVGDASWKVQLFLIPLNGYNYCLSLRRSMLNVSPPFF